MLRCLEVWIALEGQAAALAAERHTPEQLYRIIALLDELTSDLDRAGVPVEADFEFHRAVAEASGNGLFAEC